MAEEDEGNMRLVFVWIMLVLWIVMWLINIIRLIGSGKSPLDNYVILIQSVIIVLACLAIAYP